MGLSYVFLEVEDLDQSIDFYTRVMGLVVYFRDGQECAFLRSKEPGGAALALYDRAAARVGGVLFSVEAEDLSAVIRSEEHPEMKGARMEKVPSGRIVRLLDPDGNMVELHESVRPVQREDGHER